VGEMNKKECPYYDLIMHDGDSWYECTITSEEDCGKELNYKSCFVYIQREKYEEKK
jgi:hypothetical protein